ncbi:hypothetical protein ACPV5R_11145, partial [Vibrio astriarenae]
EYETQFILTAPNWLNFNSDNNPARGGRFGAMMRKVRIACWSVVVIASISSYLYFAYFESTHNVPHIEQLSTHSVEHGH